MHRRHDEDELIIKCFSLSKPKVQMCSFEYSSLLCNLRDQTKFDLLSLNVELGDMYISVNVVSYILKLSCLVDVQFII